MSRHHRASGWANKAAKARAIIKTQLPLPCVECGNPVYPGDTFDVGHIVPLSQGGNTNQYGASHRACNRSHGGKLGAQQTNRQRKQLRKW